MGTIIPSSPLTIIARGPLLLPLFSSSSLASFLFQKYLNSLLLRFLLFYRVRRMLKFILYEIESLGCGQITNLLVPSW